MAYRLNFFQHNSIDIPKIEQSLSLSILSSNDEYYKLEKEFKNKFKFDSLISFSFSKFGFLSLLMQLNDKGKIAISKAETEDLIEAANLFIKLGFELIFLDLNKDGSVNLKNLEKNRVDFLFMSSYSIDTFYINDLKAIKNLYKNIKIISNASSNFDNTSDCIYFDPYKLTGFVTNGLVLFNDKLFEDEIISKKDFISLLTISKTINEQKNNTNIKNFFKKCLEKTFQDDIYYFIDNTYSLSNTLHFGLKNIKARELIRTLALDDIYISNGEGCSLGLSKPSRIIQEMGYKEDISRNAISLSFNQNFAEDEIEKIVKQIHKRYLQIKILNKGDKNG